MELKERINASWSKTEKDIEAIEETIRLLDAGELRVAEQANGDWIVHDWVKKAILLYFKVSKMETHELGPYEFYDKIVVD